MVVAAITSTSNSASSNRTFMELKFNQEIPIEEAKKSSNRTFMELK